MGSPYRSVCDALMAALEEAVHAAQQARLSPVDSPPPCRSFFGIVSEFVENRQLLSLLRHGDQIFMDRAEAERSFIVTVRDSGTKRSRQVRVADWVVEDSLTPAREFMKAIQEADEALSREAN